MQLPKFTTVPFVTEAGLALMGAFCVDVLDQSRCLYVKGRHPYCFHLNPTRPGMTAGAPAGGGGDLLSSIWVAHGDSEQHNPV